jgi:polyhydroxybutyrate depolymerase
MDFHGIPNYDPGMKRIHIGLSVILLAGQVTVGFAAVEPETMTWTIDGTVRRALVYAPSKGVRGKLPVVFAFHGGGDNVEHFSIAGFQDAWPEALIVYMQALERNPGRGDTGFQNSDPSPANRDLEFFDTVLADMRQRFRVDDSRIFAAGFSNGARFVYLLWATRSRTFAAFALVAGTLTAAIPLKEPKAFIQIGGREDHNVEFKQQMESVDIGKTLNGANGPGAPCGDDCTLYRSSKGAPVITIIHSGGHLYPSFATDAIVTFFRSHP